ncbi:hypothetical protein MHIR_DE00213 [Candidatus Doolittlea endobia]|uniref:Uncharacterized protein n=1 Tax=Candidatus Doolittlea endobia TaxID=1778262 RepID=A0A143WRU7_9ENTR|nr:hypothetical protein MHIR_DE00213 [Candidatus Doolittlea endobia]
MCIGALPSIVKKRVILNHHLTENQTERVRNKGTILYVVTFKTLRC